MEAQAPFLYYATLYARGTLLPPKKPKAPPVLSLPELGGEVALTRKRLLPKTRKALAKVLAAHPEGLEVGARLWPRTKEGRLDLARFQLARLSQDPARWEGVYGRFFALGIPQAWEEVAGYLVLEIRPNPQGLLPKPFPLEVMVPKELRPKVAPPGEGLALRVRGRAVSGLLVVEDLEALPPPPARVDEGPTPPQEGSSPPKGV
ncbi:hypothetical protein [Thermus sp.]|uniref:hypothetical protein n=1 Tax=Thermus sp. TaxID=275 RepID=UPI003D12093B